MTSELTHLPPISTNVDDVRRVFKSAEQDATSVDTPSSSHREIDENSSLQEKMADFLAEQPPPQKEDDDGSVSISSVEVSSCEEDDDDDDE